MWDNNSNTRMTVYTLMGRERVVVVVKQLQKASLLSVGVFHFLPVLKKRRREPLMLELSWPDLCSNSFDCCFGSWSRVPLQPSPHRTFWRCRPFSSWNERDAGLFGLQLWLQLTKVLFRQKKTRKWTNALVFHYACLKFHNNIQSLWTSDLIWKPQMQLFFLFGDELHFAEWVTDMHKITNMHKVMIWTSALFTVSLLRQIRFIFLSKWASFLFILFYVYAHLMDMTILYFLLSPPGDETWWVGSTAIYYISKIWCYKILVKRIT